MSNTHILNIKKITDNRGVTYSNYGCILRDIDLLKSSKIRNERRLVLNKVKCVAKR